MIAFVLLGSVLAAFQSENKENDKHEFKVDIHEIICADFFTTFSECCDESDKSDCRSNCSAKLIFKMGSENFENDIALPYDVKNRKISKSFKFSETSFQIPTAVHIMLVDNSTELAIERWVLIYQLINLRQISLNQRGVHWKCKINITFELLCKDSTGVGCKQKCQNTVNPNHQTCDHLNGNVVCNLLKYGRDCQSEFKASRSVGVEGLISYAFWMSLAVNSLAIIMIYLIRRYANLDLFSHIDIGNYFNSFGPNNKNLPQRYPHGHGSYKIPPVSNTFE